MRRVNGAPWIINGKTCLPLKSVPNQYLDCGLAVWGPEIGSAFLGSTICPPISHNASRAISMNRPIESIRSWSR